MVADQRILRGVAATLSWQPVDSNGEPAAPAGAVTVAVAASDGTVVLPAGTATAGTGDDPRTVALTATEAANLDLLTAVWTDAGDLSTYTTLVEVVGGYYFSLADARAADPALSNDTKYPDELLIATRAAVEEEFEAICGVSFVPRFTREVVDASCGLNLTWPEVRSVRGVAAWDGDTYTAWTDLDYILTGGDSIITGPFCRGGRYRVDYEHGFDRPPADVKRVALIRLRHLASASLTGIPDRATSFSVAEGGTYRLARAHIMSTGIDEVDAVLARRDHRSRVHG